MRRSSGSETCLADLKKWCSVEDEALVGLVDGGPADRAENLHRLAEMVERALGSGNARYAEVHERRLRTAVFGRKSAVAVLLRRVEVRRDYVELRDACRAVPRGL